MADQTLVSNKENIKQSLEQREKQELRNSTISRFKDGALSGLVSGAILQPLQVIKTSMQVSPIEKPSDHHHQSKAYKKMMATTKHRHYELLSFKEATMLIYEREGFRGYFRGFLPSIIKNTLNAGTYFSTLYYLRFCMMKMNNMSDHAVNFWASASARAIQTTICNPLVVIKTRFEVLGFQEYNSLYDGVKKIFKNEGALGFFTGLKISLIRDVPFSGLFYPIYEISKSFYSNLLGLNYSDDQNKSRLYRLALLSILSSVTANLLSCMITHPLDIIRTRTFFQYYNKDQTQHYKGIFSAFLKIYEYDGFIGYFRGLTPRIMRKGLGNIVAWGLFEYLVDKRAAVYID